MMWSRKFKKCIKCGTTKIEHTAKGLCRKCYNIKTEAEHKKHERHKRGVAEEFLTKERLIELYHGKGMSLTDIGKLAGCTRVNVHYKLKRFEIGARSKTDARTMALDKGKIKTTKIDEFGNEKEVVFQKIRYNQKFFKEWSSEMAYALGLIYTDGSLHIRKDRSGYELGALSFGQKDKELVEKLLKLMDCDAPIRFRERKEFEYTTAGELYYFSIGNNLLADDLIRLGLAPNKSLNMKLPDIPDEYFRHFVRGTFDGDGSVYLDKKINVLRIKLLSGSKSFIEQLNTEMTRIGFPKMNISYSHTKDNPGAFFIRYTRSIDIILFYEFIYSNVNAELYYSRKKEIFDKWKANSLSISRFKTKLE